MGLYVMADFDHAAKELLNYGRRTIVGGIRQRLAVRKLNDSRELSNSTSFSVTNTPTTLRGIGEAYNYWLWAGNGRGPGGMPPVSKLEAWASRHGMEGAGFAIARKIANEGSKDFRDGKPNVYEQVIEEQEDNLNAIAEAFLQDAKTEIYPLLDSINKK